MLNLPKFITILWQYKRLILFLENTHFKYLGNKGHEISNLLKWLREKYYTHTAQAKVCKY